STGSNQSSATSESSTGSNQSSAASESSTGSNQSSAASESSTGSNQSSATSESSTGSSQSSATSESSTGSSQSSSISGDSEGFRQNSTVVGDVYKKTNGNTVNILSNRFLTTHLLDTVVAQTIDTETRKYKEYKGYVDGNSDYVTVYSVYDSSIYNGTSTNVLLYMLEIQKSTGTIYVGTFNLESIPTLNTTFESPAVVSNRVALTADNPTYKIDNTTFYFDSTTNGYRISRGANNNYLIAVYKNVNGYEAGPIKNDKGTDYRKFSMTTLSGEYTVLPKTATPVTINYVDVNGNKLIPSVTASGYAGIEEYIINGSPETSIGIYNLDLDKSTNVVSGGDISFDTSLNTITYVYVVANQTVQPTDPKEPNTPVDPSNPDGPKYPEGVTKSDLNKAVT
ncbi:hypothetical protein JK214_15890, partial [Lactiplantibacillus plantarum]|nr:hypothetical protein [Lactiplantibacillus plantarum]